MRFGRQEIWVSGLALAWAAAAGVAGAQSAPPATPPAAQAPAQQAIPDAPKPQALPQLNTITPVGAALPSAPAPNQTPTAADNNGGVAPGSALPAAQAASAQTQDDDPQPEILTGGQGPKTFRIIQNVQLIELPFTVKDSKGHLVPGLTPRDVRIYEDGLKQQMRYFTVDPFPLSVALVIDQSVTFDTMEKINSSLSALQGAFTPYDEVAVFTYNNGVKKQTDFTGAQSARLGVILDRSKGEGREPVQGLTGPLSHGAPMINNMPVDGVTDPGHTAGSMQVNIPREFHTLNDAILEAAKATASADRGRRRIVYVISDGKEYGSVAKQKDVIRYLQGNNVVVYATLVGETSIPSLGFLDRIHIPLTMREDVLPKYTVATGGGFDPEFRPKGIEASFARLTDEVRAQYTVGYYTKQSPFDEKFRKIEVRVLRPGLTISVRDGYYPSAFRARPQKPATATPASATPASPAPASPAPVTPPTTP
jgi:VWFA-related protein